MIVKSTLLTMLAVCAISHVGCTYSGNYVEAQSVQVNALSPSAVWLEVYVAPPGSPYDCGVVAVGAVAQFYGRPLEPDAEARLRELADKQESMTVRDMTEALELAGMEVFALRGDLSDQMCGIPWHLRAGRPCIVLVNHEPDRSVGHFLVISGYDPIAQYILTPDPKHGIVAIRQSDFQRLWSNASNVLLVAAPAAANLKPD